MIDDKGMAAIEALEELVLGQAIEWHENPDQFAKRDLNFAITGGSCNCGTEGCSLAFDEEFHEAARAVRDALGPNERFYGGVHSGRPSFSYGPFMDGDAE